MRKLILSGPAFCGYCGKELVLTAWKRHYIRQNPGAKSFCNHECYSKTKSGEGNPKWRGGKTINDGYVYVYMPTHPLATKQGYVAEHRLVVEKTIGRFLKREETVHHIDGNPLNNSPDNLRPMPCEGEHRRLHAKYRTRENNRYCGHKEGITEYI